MSFPIVLSLPCFTGQPWHGHSALVPFSPSLGMHAMGHDPCPFADVPLAPPQPSRLVCDISRLVCELEEQDRDESTVIMDALALSPCTALLVIKSFGFTLD